ncbi:MAG: nitrous oxide reductase family maturation protein NosD [Desulfomonilia bacterium]|nr:nitrous oxide reductase family maturation protein NosD [Deltaproteobacteria bacterium]
MKTERQRGFGILAILALLIFPGAAGAKTLLVAESGGDFTSLGQALAAVSPGDTIEVGPGTYQGNIVIKGEDIRIIGHGDPVIQGGKTGTVVTMTGKNITFTGFTVKGGGRDLCKDDSGLMFKHCTQGQVEDCRFLDNLFGCYFYQSDNCVFRNNLISGREHDVQEERGNGIHLWDAAYYLIEGNEIRHARDGIYVSFANYGMIRDNWIHHTRYGLHYMYSEGNRFNENLLTDNVAGAAVMYSKNMEWNRNVFAHNRGFRAYGVLWQDVRHSECRHNLVIDNTIGLYFDHAGESEVANNLVVWNDIAAVVLENSELNTIYGNNFINNLSNVQLRGGTQKGRNNTFFKDGQGNFWDDYRGYDLDGDGIGDNPHTLQDIFEFMLALEPAYRLFLFSPVSQAISTAEKVFPIIDISTEGVDPHPLIKKVEVFEQEKLFEKLNRFNSGNEGAWQYGRLITLICSLLMLGLSVLVIARYYRKTGR